MSLNNRLVIVLVLAFVSLLLSLCVGQPNFSPWQLRQLLGQTEPTLDALIFSELRLPRVMAAVLVGSALGLSGCLLQRISGNTLASPATFALTQGAAFGLVLLLISQLALTPLNYFTFAFLGTLLSLIILLLISQLVFSRLDATILLFLGALLAGLFSALTTSMLLLDQHALSAIRFWLAGSLEYVNPELLPLLAVCCVSGFILAVCLYRPLSVYETGQHTAASLGSSPRHTLLATGLCVVLLTGASVAVAGPVLFLGLIVPHLARLIFGHSIGYHLLSSAILGAGLLLLADFVVRQQGGQTPLSPSIPLAIIGVPLFMLLVYKRYQR